MPFVRIVNINKNNLNILIIVIAGIICAFSLSITVFGIIGVQ